MKFLDAKQKVKVEFYQSEHFPIDVYLLVDLSKSMDHHLDKVRELAKDLANTLKYHSEEKARIGFGSFRPGAYGFHNHLSLSSTYKFSSYVSIFEKIETMQLGKRNF